MHRARRPYTSPAVYVHRRPPHPTQGSAAIYFAVLRRFMCIASAGNIHRTHMLRVLCVHICIVCVSYVLDVRVYAWYYGHMTWMPTGYALIPSPSNCVWRCEDWPRIKWAFVFHISWYACGKTCGKLLLIRVWWTRSFPQQCHTFPQCCGKLRG